MLLFLPNSLLATHAQGADISYTCLGNNMYEVNLSFFRDCDGASEPSDASVTLSSVSCGQSFNQILAIDMPAMEISQTCDSVVTSCNGGPFSGTTLTTYSAVVTLPAECTDWVISYGICCRNAVVTNLVTPDNFGLYVEATLDNTGGLCNNSVQFTQNPVFYACANQVNSFNHGAFDLDGDSLVFTLIQALSDDGITLLNYNAPLTFNDPLATNLPTGFNFNSTNGTITFDPSPTFNGLPQFAVVAILVEEYRSGVKVGSTIREMQIIVTTGSQCNELTLGEPNVIFGTVSTVDSSQFIVCAGDNFVFTFCGYDLDSTSTDSLTVSTNIGLSIPGAVLQVLPPFNPDSVCVVIGWNTEPEDGGSYNFSVTFDDGACPVSNVATVGFQIVVSGVSISTSDSVICPGVEQDLQMEALGLGLNGTNVGTFSWTQISGPPITFSNTTIPNPLVTVPATTVDGDVILLQVTFDDGSCVTTDQISINTTITAPYNLDASLSDTSLCNNGIAQPILLNASVSGAGIIPQDATWTWTATTGGALDSTNTANTTASPIGPNPIDYSVTFNYGLCTDTEQFTVEFDAATLSVFANPDTICVGESTQLSVLYTPVATSYQWEPTAFVSNDSIADPMATPLLSSWFYVTVSDGECPLVDSVFVEVESDLPAPILTCGSSGIGTTSFQWAAITGATGYQISLDNGVTFINPNGPGGLSHDVTGLFSGECVTVYVTSTGGGSSTCGNGVATITCCAVDCMDPYFDGINPSSCAGSPDGSIIVGALNAVSPTYTISTTPPQTLSGGAGTVTFNNLVDGAYTISITDTNNGCVDVISGVVPTTTLITTSTSSTRATCGDNGTAEVIPTGGVTPYTYLWNDPSGQTTATAVDLFEGTYLVTVTDAGGCSTIDSAIVQYTGPVLELSASDTIICAGDTTDLFANLSATFPGLPCGIAPGSTCIGPENQISIGSALNPNPGTAGFSETPFQAEASGARMQILYTAAELSAQGLSPGLITEVTFDVAQLKSSGNYNGFTLRIGCTVFNDLALTGFVPLLDAAYSSNTTITAGLNTFVLSAPFQWDGSSNLIIEACFNNPSPSLSDPVNYTPTSFASVLYSYSNSVPGCSQDNPAVVLSVSGNRPNIQLKNCANTTFFSWSPNNSLSDSTSANTQAFPTVTTTYTVQSIGLTDEGLILNGDFEDGSAQITSDYIPGTGGPFGILSGEGQYVVSNNSALTHINFASCVDHTTGTGNMLVVNAASTINQNIWCETVSITPNTDYFLSGWITNVEPSNPAIIQFSVNGSLVGSPFGSPSGTTCLWSEFTATWNSGINTSATVCIVNQNLAVGGNDFALDDITISKGCLLTESIEIVVEQFLPPPTNVNCTVNNVDIEYTWDAVTGATGYEVSTDGGNNWVPANGAAGLSHQLTNISGGTAVTLLVRASNLISSNCPNGIASTTCTSELCEIIEISTTSTTCVGAADGALEVTTNNGVGPYNYTAVSGALTIGPQTSGIFTGLTAGVYLVTSLDSLGCSDSIAITVDSPPATLINGFVTDVGCLGGNNGAIDVVISGGNPPYTFNWSNGATTEDLNNITAGSYSVTVTDFEGCSVTDLYTVNETAASFAVELTPNPFCLTDADGSINSNVIGGNSPYGFLWSNNATTADLIGLASGGVYSVTVTDANGCTATSNTTIEASNPPIIDPWVQTVGTDTITIFPGNPVEVNAGGNSPESNVTYSWSGNGVSYLVGTNNFSELANVVDVSINGFPYEFEVTADNGICPPESGTVYIITEGSSLYMPNAFTPNLEIDNIFKPIIEGNPEIKEFKIFNRWGQIVYDDPAGNGWDGNFNGVQQPKGVFVYLLVLRYPGESEDTVFKGDLTLVK